MTQFLNVAGLVGAMGVSPITPHYVFAQSPEIYMLCRRRSFFLDASDTIISIKLLTNVMFSY